MNTSCIQCGTDLKESAAFCNNCGAHISKTATPNRTHRFCTKCGAPLSGQAKFCNKCGTSADVATIVPPSVSGYESVAASSASSANVMTAVDAAPRSSAVAPTTAVLVAESTTPAVPQQSSTLTTRKSSGISKFAIAVAAVLLVFIVAGVASITYVVHRVRQKVTQVEAEGNPDTNAAKFQPPKSNSPNTRNRTPVEELRNTLNDLSRAAPDNTSSSAVDKLRAKLDELDMAVRRDPNDSAAAENLKKGLEEISAAATQLAPTLAAATDSALTPPPISTGGAITPVAGTGDPKHDWPLEYERTAGGREADLVVRTGDVNNLGFGWPSGFDPFSGDSTEPHLWPSMIQIPAGAPPGTDRIILGTGLTVVHMSLQHRPGQIDRIMIDSATRTSPGDGYSNALSTCYSLASISNSVLRYQKGDHFELPPNYDDSVLAVSTQSAAQCTAERLRTMPTPIVLQMGQLPGKIDDVEVQIFVDDFQAPHYQSYFQISLNGTRIPGFESVINSLDQSGPIGKLVTMKLLPEYWPLLQSGDVKLLIDDPATHVRDGYAIDFVRILVNPHKFRYQVSLTATVTDADKHTPISGATVNVGPITATTDQQGKCELKGIPAGLAVATGNAEGYDQTSIPVDLSAGQSGHADIPLRPHKEDTAALERSIAQTGTAAIYGIHFDTGSSKLRGDSLPALNAVLGVISGRAASNWIISGHTDNQGSDALNIPLSKARAASVVAWLTDHGITANRLQPQGYGSTRPIGDNANATGRALNRRVEVSLWK